MAEVIVPPYDGCCRTVVKLNDTAAISNTPLSVVLESAGMLVHGRAVCDDPWSGLGRMRPG
jgi:hypothetical protein